MCSRRYLTRLPANCLRSTGWSTISRRNPPPPSNGNEERICGMINKEGILVCDPCSMQEVSRAKPDRDSFAKGRVRHETSRQDCSGDWGWFRHGQGDIHLIPVSYTHLRAHETVLDLVCRLLLE